MRIKHLKIENFHCFKDAEFDFADQTTVFIGKNGTGKSSLIKALCNALSFIFNKSNNSWGFSSLANEVSDLGVGKINVREIYHNDRIADYVSIQGSAYMYPTDENKHQHDNFAITWDFRRNSYERATIQSSLYKDAYIKFRNHIKQTDRYPLLVFYSDRYPHINTNLGPNAKAMLNEDDEISRTWGYYHWNEFSSCTEIWQKRFIRISNQLMRIDRSLIDTVDDGARDKLLKQKKSIINEIEYVTGYLKSFSDNNIEGLSDCNGDFKISSIGVDGATEFYIKFTFADGIQRTWDELPAGLERLFSIVFDMAYRCYILNKGKSSPNGLALIDEVDLHLHPSLQQDVLLRLTQTFPEVQFIVTTHSPLVITNLRQNENNRVIRMERNMAEYSHSSIGNLFIHDYAYTLYEIMQTSPRNFILDSLSERYIRLKRRAKEQEAEMVLNQLRKLVGDADFPTLYHQLESDLNKG